MKVKRMIICSLLSTTMFLLLFPIRCTGETVRSYQTQSLVVRSVSIVPEGTFLSYFRGSTVNGQNFALFLVPASPTGASVGEELPGLSVNAKSGGTYYDRITGAGPTITRMSTNITPQDILDVLPTDAWWINYSSDLNTDPHRTRENAATRLAADCVPGENYYLVTTTSLREGINYLPMSNGWISGGDITSYKTLIPGMPNVDHTVLRSIPIGVYNDDLPTAASDLSLDVTTFADLKYPPDVTTPPLPVSIGSRRSGLAYAEGVTAVFGHSRNPIPLTTSNTTISGLDSNGDCPMFSNSNDGGLIRYIGQTDLGITVDDKSEPQDPSANVTTKTRTVKGSTSLSPSVSAVIHEDSQATPYSSTGENPGGGVEGWTKYPVTVTEDATSIPGDYTLWADWSPPAGAVNPPDLDATQTTTGARGAGVSINSVFQGKGTDGAGWKLQAYCAQQNHQSGDQQSTRANKLSVVSSLEVRYDPDPPHAALNYDETSRKFSEGSTDAGSGLIKDKTAILFAKVGADAPTENASGWKPLDGYKTPMHSGTNFDVYVKAYDKAGNYDIRLAKHDVKLHDKVDGTIATDLASQTVNEGTRFTYRYTLKSTGDPATGTFTNYLPVGVVPTGTPLAVDPSVSGNASLTNLTITPPDPTDHPGQYKVKANYTLRDDPAALGGDTLAFTLECYAPQYGIAPDNTYVNEDIAATYQMKDSYQGDVAFPTPDTYQVVALPTHALTLTNTVTGAYGNQDKAFHFKLKLVQSFGAPLTRDCTYERYPGTGGAPENPDTGTITIRDGIIVQVDGTQEDTLSLKHGQKIIVKGLPEGCKLNIKEDPGGYTPSVQVTGTDESQWTPEGVMTGTLKTADVTVAYTNDRSNLMPPTGLSGLDMGSEALLAILGGLAVLGTLRLVIKRRRIQENAGGESQNKK